MAAQVGIYGEGLSEPSYKDTIAYQMFVAPVRAAKVRCPAMAVVVDATQFPLRAACEWAPCDCAAVVDLQAIHPFQWCA